MSSCELQFLNTVSYASGLKTMMQLHEDRVNNKISDQLLVLEHTPVITKGRRLHKTPVPGEDAIQKLGIDIENADRGGELTYHGPGQIVVYFILKFEDHFPGVQAMVKKIESLLMAFLKQYNIETHLDPDNPGIWVRDKKIASIGLRVEKGVTRHGISLNINNDLKVYDLFNPCGMSGQVMTNLSTVLNRAIDDAGLKDITKNLGQFMKENL